VPLRGTGAKKLIVYSDDNFVGCAGWLCCASGVTILMIFFIISALPGLQDQWQWLESECYVISHNRTCIDAAMAEPQGVMLPPPVQNDAASMGCTASMQVALSSAPVCNGTACAKRQRTVYYDPADTTALDDADPEIWLLTHERGQVFRCWENALTNATSFREPMASVWGQMTLPFAVSLFFFAGNSNDAQT